MQTNILTESRFLVRDVGERSQRNKKIWRAAGNENVCYLNCGRGSMDVYMCQDLSDCDLNTGSLLYFLSNAFPL